MRVRRAKPLLTALLLSFLFHLALLLSPAIELTHWEKPPTLTVTLQEPPPKPIPPIAAPKPPPRPKVHKPAPPPRVAPIAAIAEPDPVAIPVPTETAPTPPTPTEPALEPEPERLPAPPVIEPPLLTARVAFPAHIEMQYAVHRGDRGIKLGTTTHTWHVSGNQYLLTSTTEASGLFSLFYSGRYILTSRGIITPDGLQPTSFWIQRGQSTDHTEYAEFNWEAKTLDFGKSNDRHSAAITSGAQDQLSVFYQLALTAPHSSGLRFTLTTGRKFNQYTYQLVGEETLDTALGKMKTQRLTRVLDKIDSNESTDIWLAIDYHYLPVRFRLGTRDGEVLDHWVKEIRLDGQRVEIKPEVASPPSNAPDDIGR